MKIAIIGTGNVGRAFGGSLVRAGHEVTLAARDEVKTRTVAGELGASAASTPREAAKDVDVVVLAVPFESAAEQVARDLLPVATGKVVIDVTNPIKPDFSGLLTEGGPSAAERIAEWLPNARVVKAFNTLFASIQGDPDIHGTELDALYATDDEEARTTTARLISSIGFRPIDVGQLVRARELEGLAWLNMQLQVRHEGDWRSAFSLVGAPSRAIATPVASR